MSKTPRYSEQFKRDAVRLVLEEGYSHKAAGKAVGVCHTTIASWVNRLGIDVGQNIVHASPEDEIRHLREENRRLRMEREILKKAAAFFAKEDQS
jgi:transposase